MAFLLRRKRSVIPPDLHTQPDNRTQNLANRIADEVDRLTAVTEQLQSVVDQLPRRRSSDEP